MASISEIEGCFSLLGLGMAGLRLLKKYGVRGIELEYFIENFGKSKVEIFAFAPSPLKDQYEPLFTAVEEKVAADIETIRDPNVSDEGIENALTDIRAMYSLISDIHRTVASGFIIT